MFGFLKKIFRGSDAAAPAAMPRASAPEVLTISPEDLDSPASLGPKLAAFAMMQDGVSEAVYDPQTEVLKVRYRSGTEATNYLDNVTTVMRRAESGEAVVSYLENYFTDPSPDSDDGGEGHLLPVLKAAGYAEHASAILRENGKQGDDANVWSGELAPGLEMILMRDSPTKMQLVTVADLEAAGLDGETTMTEAQVSLINYVNDKGLRVSTMENGLLHHVQLDDNYEASTFFLEGFWNQLETDMGGAPAAIFAARNIVVFANSADPEAMEMLNAVASAGGDAPPYAIAPDRIWLWQDDSWQPWQAPPAKPPVLH